MGAIAPPSYRRSVALSPLLSPPCSTSSPGVGAGGAGGAGGGRSCGVGPSSACECVAFRGPWPVSAVVSTPRRIVPNLRSDQSSPPACLLPAATPECCPRCCYCRPRPLGSLVSTHPCTLHPVVLGFFLFPEQPCFGRSVAFNITRGY